MFHHPVRLLALVLIVPLAGCGGGAGEGGSGNQARQTMGPHGGIAVPLADRGYAELVAEGTGGGSVLAVYLLQSDLKSPLASQATSVAADLETAAGTRSFTFQPKPGKGSAESNRYEAASGGLEEDRFAGTLKVALDGQNHEIAITPF